MTFLALGLLLTFCLYCGHCCLSPCSQEHVCLPSLSQVCSRNSQELLLVSSSPVLIPLHFPALCTVPGAKRVLSYGCRTSGEACYYMGSEAPLEKHSSVMVSLKCGSVHLRLSWAEGNEGGGEERNWQLSSSSPWQWDVLGIWNLKHESKRQTFHLLTAWTLGYLLKPSEPQFVYLFVSWKI